jgi:hypothetical protein
MPIAAATTQVTATIAVRRCSGRDVACETLAWAAPLHAVVRPFLTQAMTCGGEHDLASHPSLAKHLVGLSCLGKSKALRDQRLIFRC